MQDEHPFNGTGSWAGTDSAVVVGWQRLVSCPSRSNGSVVRSVHVRCTSLAIRRELCDDSNCVNN